jgi:membrane fusion protein (multidrug efflux system)
MKVCSQVLHVFPVLLTATMLIAGCGKGDAGEEAGREAEKIVLVEVTEAVAARAEDWLELPGKIEPFRDVTVSAEVGGLLEWLGADEGEAVSKGQKLVVIDRENLELKEKQAELVLEQARIGEARALIGIEQAEAGIESAAALERQAEAGLAGAGEREKKAAAMREESERDRDRGQSLLEEQLAPQSRVDDLEMAVTVASSDLASAGEGVKASLAAREAAVAAKRMAAAGLRAAEENLAANRSQVKTAEANLEEARLYLRRSTITSPLDGYVDHTFFEAGELVPAQDPVLRIVQVKPVKAVFHLPERDVPFLEAGAEASVTVAALSERAIEGSVSLVGVTSDPATSTYRMEVDLANADGLLRPGMLVRLRLLRRSIDDAVSVPVFSVISGEEDSYLFLHEDGVARRRTVTTGIINGDRIQIVEGVAPGELVIVKGQRDLEDGQAVVVP